MMAPRYMSKVIPAVALGLSLILSACGGPRQPFSAIPSTPTPDYRQSGAWLAWPGRDGLERSTPEGLTRVNEAEAPADVFFIHPTTTSARDVWNVPWDADGEAAPLNGAVLLAQASVFNGCCRIYAPRYRQATLPGLSEPQAVDLAYEDVAAAFRLFIAEHSDGRPFILASHSQGTGHAVRLVQEEILGTPLQSRMVVAYLIGAYVPANFADAGLPICDGPRQTGCVLTWNASKVDSQLARIIIRDKTYWWQGAPRSEDQAPALCVNPLTWRAGDTDTPAPAEANAGSLPFPARPYPVEAVELPALDVGLTGARCHDGMLEAALPDTAGAGYSDDLTRLFGSYHLQDYGLFYGALRANAIERTAAWVESHRD